MKNDKGLFVIMEPKTGELLALVSTPSYDSNDFTVGLSQEKWDELNNDEANPLYNRFIQKYCPGSTFKAVTGAIGLTTGDITTKDWLKVWWKEFRVSLLVSIVLASFNFIRIAFFTKAPEGVNVYMIAISVSGALFLIVILTKSVGGLLPILAKKLKLDPAVMAAPLITTLVDAVAIIIYFTFVSHLLF